MQKPADHIAKIVYISHSYDSQPVFTQAQFIHLTYNLKLRDTGFIPLKPLKPTNILSAATCYTLSRSLPQCKIEA